MESCKIPQQILLKLLEGFKSNDDKRIKCCSELGDKTICKHVQEMGAGLDCSITSLKHNLSLIQTTDFFYPIVDEPYVMGQIACANVLSDIYTLGITEIDSLQIILGIPCDMTSNERDVVTKLIGEGFKERAKTAGCEITGGDTKENAWLMIGGVATSVISPSNFIRPTSAEAGDGIILTKPLGTTAATTLYRWLADAEKLTLLKDCITKDEIESAYFHALHSMITLNRAASSLMHSFGVHAATDITGYGLIGHAENLLRHQTNKIDFIIDTLPLINFMHKVDIHLNNRFKLVQGKGIETSGGLLICLPLENVNNFIKTLKEIDGSDSWLIGKVIEGNGNVKIHENNDLNIINVISPVLDCNLSQ